MKPELSSLMKDLIGNLQCDEGYRAYVYLDSEGLPHCGWGHRLKVGSPVPVEASEAFFKADVARAVDNFCKLPPVKRNHLNKDVVRKRVITEMLFILGYVGCLRFSKMWAAIETGNWQLASHNILWNDDYGKIKTPFYRQTGERAERLSKELLSGQEAIE